MNKVYIVCEPTMRKDAMFIRAFDLTPAAQWGEPVILMENPQSFMNSVQTIEVLRERLASFSDDDFLVPIGDPTLMCTCAMVAGSINNGRVKMLKWDRKLEKYFPIQIDLNRKATHG